MKSHLKLVTPNTKNRTVTPKRKPNADLRTREYLTDREVEMLSEAAKTNRWGTAMPPWSLWLTGTGCGQASW